MTRQSRMKVRGRLHGRMSAVYRPGFLSGGEKRSHDLERGIGVEGTMVSVVRIATCRSPEPDAAHPSALTGLL